jgi:3-phenylpropionate/trans-cinnamate dioxygenase ferredoxin subunit
MGEKEYTWHLLAESVEALMLPQTGLKEIEVAGKKICIGRYRDELFACSALCPHAGGRMANGYTDAVGNIVCPTHRYKFSLQNGRNSSGEGYFLKTYPVQIRTDAVFVGFEVGNLFKWLK